MLNTECINTVAEAERNCHRVCLLEIDPRLEKQDCEDYHTLWLKFKAKLGMLSGEVSLLLNITYFVAESDSLQKQNIQRVWRTLSRKNKEEVEGADSAWEAEATCRPLQLRGSSGEGVRCGGEGGARHWRLAELPDG